MPTPAYRGQWNTGNTTPVLSNGTGTIGDFYTIIGTPLLVNFGSGPVQCTPGQTIVYTLANAWIPAPIAFTATIDEMIGNSSTGGGGGGMTNPMTTLGDMIYGFTAGAPVRLPIGATGQVLEVVGGIPSWTTLSATGIATIDGDSTAAQTLSVGTTGTNFAIVDNGIGDHKFNLPTASASNRGALSPTDWSTFNNKIGSAITSLNGLTGAIQTFNNDINIIITSSGTIHQIGWLGTLQDARITSASVWNAKQSALYGVGYIYQSSGTSSYITGTSSQFVKANGTLDSSTYLSSPMTTPGDLIYESSGSTAVRLPIGINGQILSVVSGLPKWLNTSGTTYTASQGVKLISNDIELDYTYPGTFTNATWNANTIPINKGGTGQTTAITAFNALSPNTIVGDITYETSGTTNGRLPIGITGQLLTVQSTGVPAWQSSTALTNPMTTTGDMIYQSSGGTVARLTDGFANQVLTMSPLQVPVWSAYTGLVEEICFNDITSSISNNTYTLDLYAEYGYIINELKIASGSGTCTAALQIGGVNITGISAVSVSSSIATGTATGANTVTIGSKLTLVLSSTSSLNNLQGTIKFTRT